MDKLNLICHPPLEMTKGNPASRSGEDAIQKKLK